MEQTFEDLCNERAEEGIKRFSLTLHLSVDTGIGIIKEHVLHLSQTRRNMRKTLRNPKIAAMIGILLFLPAVLIVAALTLNIDPALEFLDAYVAPPGNVSHLLGSLAILGLLLVLPAGGIVINAVASDGNPFKNIFSNLTFASIIGTLLVLPFVILEVVMGQKSYSSFPFALFAILWVLPVMFSLVGLPIVQNMRTGQSPMKHPIALILRIAFLVLIAVFWAGLINDQLPCFLGVPNCD